MAGSDGTARNDRRWQGKVAGVRQAKRTMLGAMLIAYAR